MHSTFGAKFDAKNKFDDVFATWNEFVLSDSEEEVKEETAEETEDVNEEKKW